MKLNELLEKVDATPVDDQTVSEMMERLDQAQKELQEAASQKSVDEDFLSLTYSL
jgi:hypothetical protein